MSYPKAVIFDLDYTLWPCWCDTHISTPIKSIDKTTIKDSSNFKLSFYRDVDKIFKDLISKDVIIIGASRTCAPNIAKKLLKLLYLNENDDKSSIHFFNHLEFGTFSKKNHIKNALDHLYSQEGIEIELNETILFDDELRNKDVESIGVQFQHIPDETYGLTYNIYNKGLDKYRQSKEK